MKKGFTLIELLVVIAIIGILASVVLTSLSSSREKAMDAKYKTTLASARAQAELFYSDNSNYTTVCASGTTANGLSDIKGTLDGAFCTSSATAWVMTGKLSGTSKYWCVDSKGNSTSSATSTKDLTNLCQ